MIKSEIMYLSKADIKVCMFFPSNLCNNPLWQKSTIDDVNQNAMTLQMIFFIKEVIYFSRWIRFLWTQSLFNTTSLRKRYWVRERNAAHSLAFGRIINAFMMNSFDKIKAMALTFKYPTNCILLLWLNCNVGIFRNSVKICV